MLNLFELDGFWILRGKQPDLLMSWVTNEPLLSEEVANRSSGALCWLFSVETRGIVKTMLTCCAAFFLDMDWRLLSVLGPRQRGHLTHGL